MSSLSIATGDLRMLSATRDAVTTTSFPNTVCVVSSMSSFESSPVISYSCCSNPIEENISLKGNLSLVLYLKVPALLVMVPATVPLIFTLTFGSGSLDSWLETRPDTSINELSCCALATKTMDNEKAVNNNAFLSLVVMNITFVLFCCLEKD